MSELVKVRRLTDEEGRRLQRLVRRGEGKGKASVVRYRRALVVLASAGNNTVPVIARLVQTSPDRVREVIHNFNKMGMECLDPKWAGGRPRLITTEDFLAIERQILASGYRFGWSAVISVRERPDLYKEAEAIGASLGAFSFEHPNALVGPADNAGREQRGIGDNVVRRKDNVRGIARYVRSSEQVIDYMTRGVPAGTVAIIDDSGGTLTAPILESFAGIICAGGTVRSHLSILAREYGIPCLMNAKISGIRDGDRVEIETSAAAKTAEAYQRGEEMIARIWKLAL